MECHQSQPRNFLGRGDLCLPNDRSGTIGTSFGLLGILCARTHEEDRHLEKGSARNLHSQHTKTQKVTPSTRHSQISTTDRTHARTGPDTQRDTSHTSHTRIIQKCSRTCNAYRAHRHGRRIRVAIPRVKPGSEPVQPPHLAGGWTVADTHTGMVWNGMVWHGLGLDRPPPRL